MKRRLNNVYELFEWLNQYLNSTNRQLTPASKLVWLGLTHLAYLNPDKSVKARVSDLCFRLGLCDKTLKNSVEELQKSSLLVRRNETTDLGAHSYRYCPKFPKDLNTSISCLSHELIQDLLLGPRQSKITANQRLLLILTMVLSDKFGYVSTTLHVDKLSQLAGIPTRNIYSNLRKLKDKQQLTPIQGEKEKLKLPWAFIPTTFVRSFDITLQINKVKNDEVLAVSLLSERKSIEETISLIERNAKDAPNGITLNTKLVEYSGMSLLEISDLFAIPFLGLPEKLRGHLLKTIIANGSAWKDVKRKGLLAHLNLVLHCTAIQLLIKSRDQRVIYSYLDRSSTKLILRQQLEFFPLTVEQRDKLIQIALPLCTMIATSLNNLLNSEPYKGNLCGRHIYLSSIPPFLELKFISEVTPSPYSIYISDARPNYEEIRWQDSFISDQFLKG